MKLRVVPGALLLIPGVVSPVSSPSRQPRRQRSSPPTGINNHQIAGVFDTASGYSHAVMWSNGTTAECDPLRDEGERYADAIRAAGGDATSRRYRGMIHGFFQMTGLVAAAHEAQTDIANWIWSLGDHQATAPEG